MAKTWHNWTYNENSQTTDNNARAHAQTNYTCIYFDLRDNKRINLTVIESRHHATTNNVGNRQRRVSRNNAETIAATWNVNKTQSTMQT